MIKRKKPIESYLGLHHFVDEVSDLTDLEKKEVKEVILCTIREIALCLSEGHNVRFLNFGHFRIIKGSKYRHYDINTKKCRVSKRRPKVKFVSSNALKNLVSANKVLCAKN